MTTSTPFAQDSRLAHQEFLARQEWFACLDGAEQQEAVRVAHTSTWERGEFIQRRYAPNNDWHGIVRGQAELRLAAAATRKYAPLPLAENDWFGEDLRTPIGTSVFDAVAVTPCAVLSLPMAFFQRLIHGNDAFCRFSALRFWNELSRAQQAVAMCSGTRFERVAAALMQHWNGSRTGEWIELDQGVLARYAGLSRQRANYCLRDMERDGMLQRGGRRIRVVDPRRLEHMALGQSRPATPAS